MTGANNFLHQTGVPLCSTLAGEKYVELPNGWVDMSKKIPELESRIRDYINKARIQHSLMQDTKNWNQVCSSLDVIGDTYIAIRSFLSSEFPKDTGLQYIFIYGLLQALFLQQDSIKHMSESLRIDYSQNDELEKIRNIRNDSIGHPTNRRGGKSHHFISRSSIHKRGFTLMSAYPYSGYQFVDINILGIIENQLNVVESSLQSIVTLLEEKEMKHRESFSSEKLVNLFPQTVSYYFEKIFEGIHTPSSREFGAMHLKLVHDLYKQLIERLKERGEYPANDVLVYEIDEIQYPIEKLEAFFENRSDNTLAQKDAYIFASFLSSKHSYFIDILKEIDEQYETGS